ncbi:MAG: rhomboid-like protein [Jatrophihabitantaceae bacterium]
MKQRWAGPAGEPGDRSGWDGPALARTAARVLPSPRATPLASSMVLMLVLVALLLNTHPGEADAVVAWASTNVSNLGQHPVAVLLASTFVVPGNLLPELAIVAVSFAVLERASGPWRTAAIALAGQVIASLLTEYGADLGAHWRLLADSSSERSDVGVSYVMYAVLAASVLTLAGRAKRVALCGLSLIVLVQFGLEPGMTTTGHLLSVAVGAITMALIGRHQPSSCSRPSLMPK